MICRHCGKEIWKRSPEELQIWGDGKWVVCDIVSYKRHEPLQDEDVFNDLRMIIQSLEPVDPRLL